MKPNSVFSCIIQIRLIVSTINAQIIDDIRPARRGIAELLELHEKHQKAFAEWPKSNIQEKQQRILNELAAAKEIRRRHESFDRQEFEAFVDHAKRGLPYIPRNRHDEIKKESFKEENQNGEDFHQHENLHEASKLEVTEEKLHSEAPIPSEASKPPKDTWSSVLKLLKG
jgi:hypothetical protein